MKLKLLTIFVASVVLSTMAFAAETSGDKKKAEETKKPPETKCAMSSVRHCSDKCNGEYGMMCFPGTVCNPDKHRCEKTSP